MKYSTHATEASKDTMLLLHNMEYNTIHMKQAREALSQCTQRVEGRDESGSITDMKSILNEQFNNT